MKRFVSYFIVFILGFVVCAYTLYQVGALPPKNSAVSTQPTLLGRVSGLKVTNDNENRVRDAAEVVSSYVVNIDTEGRAQRFGGPFGLPDFFGLPFGGGEQQAPKGQASGVVYSEDGYILTNNHVVENTAKLTVTLNNGEHYSAELIGRDPSTDLALIKIKPKGKLPYAQFDNSNDVKPGDWVIAVGNALGLGQTVSLGVVSARREEIEVGGKRLTGVIQTDAAINHGNSGGALADLNGKLVGINTAIASTSPGGGSIGIGFAMPSNTAKKVAEELRKHGKVKRPWIGISYGPYNEDARRQLQQMGVTGLPKEDGAIIGQIVQGSPAAQAGLQPNDIILKVNGKKIQVPCQTGDCKNTITEIVSKSKVGDRIVLDVWRADNGRMAKVGVRLAEMPQDLNR